MQTQIDQLISQLGTQLEQVNLALRQAKLAAPSLSEDEAIALLSTLIPQYSLLQSFTDTREEIMVAAEARVPNDRLTAFFETLYPDD